MMTLVKPKAELWEQPDKESGWKEHIVRCAKVCYKSDKEVDVDKFLEARLNAGHVSILRHGTKYYRIPIGKFYNTFSSYIIHSPYVKIMMDAHELYLAINCNFLYDHKDVHIILSDYEIDIIEAKNIQFLYENIFRYTFYLQTQISTSRELNRVSPNNILEESTRYVEQGVICRPWWMVPDIINNSSTPYTSITRQKYFDSIAYSFAVYQEMINDGMPREDARGVLPLDTCTHVVYTYSINEWKEIINKRYFGTTGKPHKNAREIIGQVLHILENEYGKEFFEY